MQNEIVVAAAALPGTMFILANIGSSTAQMSPGNSDAVKTGLAVASGALLLASAATGNLATVVTTGIAIAATFYVTRNIWQTPALTDLVG